MYTASNPSVNIPFNVTENCMDFTIVKVWNELIPIATFNQSIL